MRGDMLDIAIIDDDIEAIKAIKKILANIKIVDFVESYVSFNDFFKAADSGNHYDVILLDIQFNEHQNGIDYASKLFTIFPQLKVVFITGFVKEYVSEVFIPKINLAGFIEKPVDIGVMERTLGKIQEDIDKRKREVLTINSNGRTVVLPLRDITFIESDGHYINIHMEERIIRNFSSLNEIEKELPSYFKRCHRSFIVNMHYIREIGNKKLIINNAYSTQLPVSRGLYNDLRKQFFEFMGESR